MNLPKINFSKIFVIPGAPTQSAQQAAGVGPISLDDPGETGDSGASGEHSWARILWFL